MTDTRPLEWACLAILLVWSWWLILLGESASPRFWEAMNSGKDVEFFKLVALPIVIFKAAALLQKNIRRRKIAAIISFLYWYLLAFTLLSRHSYVLWHTWFCCIMAGIQAFMILQKSAVEPRPDDKVSASSGEKIEGRDDS